MHPISYSKRMNFRSSHDEERLYNPKTEIKEFGADDVIVTSQTENPMPWIPIGQ